MVVGLRRDFLKPILHVKEEEEKGGEGGGRGRGQEGREGGREGGGVTVVDALATDGWDHARVVELAAHHAPEVLQL